MAIKSKQQLQQDLLAAIYPNTNREIQAGKVQQLIKDILDSTYNQISQAALVGLKAHDAGGTNYKQGDTVIKHDAIWMANQGNSGAFTEANWDLVAGLRTRVVNSYYTVDSKGDRLIIVENGGNTVQIDLPGGTWPEARVISVVNTGSGNTDIRPDGNDTINGAAQLILRQEGGRVDLYHTGTDWVELGKELAKLDSTQRSLYTDEWEVTEWIDTTLFSQTESKQVSSIEPETLIGNGVGSNDLPENFLVPGKKIALRARGTVGISSGETLTIHASIGGQTIGTGASFGPPSPSGENWEVEVDFVARQGEVYISGFVRIIDENGDENVAQIPAGTVNVSFADPLTVDLLASLSLADDRITSEILTLSKKA